MKTNVTFLVRSLFLAMFPFAGLGVSAAPLVWYPGPSVDAPFSGAATTVSSGLGTVLIGGDAYQYYDYPLTYPESLTATNLYWNYLSPIDVLRIAPGAVATGGLILLFGGSDGTNSTSTTIGYDPSGDTPPTLVDMSVPRSYLGYAPDASGNAYAMGGLDGNGHPLASVERFNLDSDAWTSVTAMPFARYDFPAVLDHTNQIYIFGGLTNTTVGGEITSVFRYSVKNKTWTALAPMPIAVAGSGAAFGSEGNIYVVGGTSGGVVTDAVQVYNPVSNSWTISTPLPEAFSGACLGTDSLGRLIVMGGTDINGNDVSDVWRSQQLNVPDTAPAFVSFPTLTAVYETPYVSSITATSSPPPLYQLVSGPVGMQVDPFSGAITWTPSCGAILVTIQAANYAGSTNWNFDITVPNPPPTVLTNLMFVSATENSVTLSWDPEDPVAGPVTYSVYLRHFVHSPKGSGGTVWYTQIGSTTTSPMITISGLTPGSAQTYYIVATGSGGSSGYAAISAATLSVGPPANLRVTGLTSTTITLAWDAPSGPVPAASYEIWGWINNGISYSSYGKGIVGNTFTVTGLAPGTQYEWGVRSYDAEGYASGFDYGPTVVNPVPVAPGLTLSLKPSVASLIAPPPGISAQLTVTEGGSILQTVLIQATTNLAVPAAWTQIGSVFPTSNPFTFTDTSAGQNPLRFYRVIAP